MNKTNEELYKGVVEAEKEYYLHFDKRHLHAFTEAMDVFLKSGGSEEDLDKAVNEGIRKAKKQIRLLANANIGKVIKHE